MSPHPDPAAASDQELVTWARQGHELGYRELVRRYERTVHSLLYRIVRDREAANDLVQETFIKAFDALETFRPEFKFSAWILKIANNTAINHLKRTRPRASPRQQLGRLETRLAPHGFVRVHRSAIVNVDRITELEPWFHGEYVVILEDGTRLTSSAAHSEALHRIVDPAK